MINIPKQRAEAAYRTLLIHAQHVDLKFGATTMNDVTTDLLVGIMHLSKEGYNLNLTDRLAEARSRFLEGFLRQTNADQGGEASFDEWVTCTAADESDEYHEEAAEYLRINGDLSEKNLSESGEWDNPFTPVVK